MASVSSDAHSVGTLNVAKWGRSPSWLLWATTVLCWSLCLMLVSFVPVPTPWLQFSSVAQLCLTLCNPMDCSTPGLPVHHQHPDFTWTHVHWVDDAIQPSHPLSFPSPPTFSLSQHQGLFKWISSSYQSFLQWSKYWSFSFSISPSNEYSELISFRMDWLDLLAVQGTLKSLLQHHSWKASVLWHSAFFMVQNSY